MTKILRFAFLKARWHAEIVDQAHKGYLITSPRVRVVVSATTRMMKIP